MLIPEGNLCFPVGIPLEIGKLKENGLNPEGIVCEIGCKNIQSLRDLRHLPFILPINMNSLRE